MPCNLNQRELAQHVKRGIRAAGGTPMEFNTIAISDGVSMGTEGMRAEPRLPRGDRRLDRARLPRPPVRRPRLPRRLRQDQPGRRDGRSAGSTSRRSILYTGSIAPGVFRGNDVTVADVYEAIGAYAAGQDQRRRAARARVRAPAPAPARAAASSPRTRCRPSSSSSASPRRARTASRRCRRRRRRPRRSAGGSSMDLVATDVRPSQLVTRAGDRERRRLGRRDRAARRTASCTCSRSRASSASSSRSTTSTRSPARTPVIADMKPWGRFHATDVVPRRRRRPRRARAGEAGARPRRHADRRRARRSARSRPRAVETEGQEVVTTIEQPIKKSGSLRILRGNLAPDGCVRQADGRPRPSTAGPRASSTREQAAFEAVKAKAIEAGRRRRDPLRGPGRRARDARDAPGHGRDHRRGPRRLGRADHRRPLLRRDARVHGRPRRPGGVPRRPDRRAPGGRHRSASTCRPASSASSSPTTRSLARLAGWTAPPPRYTTGVLAKYAARSRRRVRARSRGPDRRSATRRSAATSACSGTSLGRVLVEQDGAGCSADEERIRALSRGARAERPAARGDGSPRRSAAAARAAGRRAARVRALLPARQPRRAAPPAAAPARVRARGAAAARVAGRGVRAARAAGVDERQLAAPRGRLSLELVLTAHPTEATRRTVLAAHAAAARAARRARRPDLSAPAAPDRARDRRGGDGALADRRGARAAAARRRRDPPRPLVLRAEPARRRRPSSSRELPRAAAATPGCRSASAAGSAATRTATPHAGPETIEEALDRARALALARYRAEVRELAAFARRRRRRSSASRRELRRSIARDERELPGYAAAIGAQNADEPYRRKLSFVWQRLGEATADAAATLGDDCSPTST